jgi:hypothetical protein
VARGSAQEWSNALLLDGRVEIGLRKGRLVLLLLSCLLFVLVGLCTALLGEGVDRVFGVAAVLFFGLGLAVFPRQLVQKEPGVVVHELGIEAPRSGVSIRWSDARGAFVFSTRGTHLVQVEADPDLLDRYYADHPVLAKTRAVNKRLTDGREALSLPSPLAVDAGAFAVWLDEEIRRRNPERP